MIEEKKDLIKEYITENECGCVCNGEIFSCDTCNNFESCYIEAEIKCNDDYNNFFARAVDYGGYGNEEDFWEQIFS